MKRKALLLVALVLALTLTAGMALAWVCPGCGSSNDGNFCPICGTAKPSGNTCSSCGVAIPSTSYNFCLNCGAPVNGSSKTPASAIAVNKISLNDDGTLNVTWSDSGKKSPYTLSVVQKRSNSYADDLANGLGATVCEENISTTSGTAQLVVPGVDYWVVVTDKDGNSSYKAYEAGYAPRFYEFNVDISMTLKYRRNNAYKEVSAFSASDFSRYHSTTTYGAYVLMDYPQLAYARHYTAIIAIETPKGDVIVDTFGDMDLDRGHWRYYWNFYELDEVLNILHDTYGNVPTGNYTFSLYLDGRFVTSTQFRVSY